MVQYKSFITIRAPGEGGTRNPMTNPMYVRTARFVDGMIKPAAVFVFCTIRLVQNVWGDPLHAILARLGPNGHQASPAHSVRRLWVALWVHGHAHFA
jgi:hypothetical protein